MAVDEQHDFGEFRFDSARLELSRRGRPVPISGLPLRILELLLESRGRLVTREEFKLALWPHAVRIDTERRLNTAIRALRETLGDRGDDPRFIETLRQRGYRWIAAPVPASAPARNRPFALLTVMLSLLVAGSTLRPSAGPTAEQQARLVRIAALPDRLEALAGVSTLIREQPAFADAQRFRAQLAVEAWRANGGPDLLAAADAAVSEASAAAGGSSALDSFAAELALAGRWNWVKAERLYRSALESDPDHVPARRGLAWLYVNSGRPGQAWAQISRLLSLSPLTGEARADLGWLLIRMNRPDLAAQVCAAEGPTVNVLACRHTALAAVGDIDSARHVALALMEQVAADPSDVATVRQAPGARGYDRFLAWRAAAFLPPNASWFQHAQVRAAAGRYRAALDCLDRALAERDPLLVKLASTAEFAPMVRTRRFQALLRAVLARA